MQKPLKSKIYKRNFCDECKFEETRRCGAKILLKPSDVLKDFDFTNKSFQHTAQILLNLVLSCSIVFLIAVILLLMPLAPLNIPVKAMFNSGWVVWLMFWALIGVNVGVCTNGVCARSIPFNCKKNKTFMTDDPVPNFWTLFQVPRLLSLGAVVRFQLRNLYAWCTYHSESLNFWQAVNITCPEFLTIFKRSLARVWSCLCWVQRVKKGRASWKTLNNNYWVFQQTHVM